MPTIPATPSAPRVCVVMYAHNDAASLPAVIRQASDHVRYIIVVDDGSTDGTAEALRQFPGVDAVTHVRGRGKGAALASGFARAAERGFTHAISMNGDGRYHCEALPAFLEAIAGNPEAIVIGVRDLKGDDPRRRGSRRLLAGSNIWVWMQTGQWMHDTQSGFRAVPLAPIQALLLKTSRGEYETELLVKASWAGVPVTELPIRADEPARGTVRGALGNFRRLAHLHACLLMQRLLLPESLRRIAHQKSFRQGSLAGNVARSIRSEFQRQCSAPRDLALALGVGVCFGILPIWGFQIAAALLVAHHLRLSKALVAVATNVSLPATIPLILYASLLTGRLALTGQVDYSLEYGGLTLATAGAWAAEYLVGSVILAVAAGAVVAAGAYGILRAGSSFSMRQPPGRRLSPFHIVTALVFAAVVAGVSSGRLWLAATALSTWTIAIFLGVVFIRMNFFCPARCRGRRGGMRVTLTFDDGPDPAVTPTLLDTLRELRVPAAFFCIGERVRAEPELAARIAREGHEIGNHSLRHGWWTNFLIGRRLREDILGTQEAIRAATGLTPRYYRSPMGLTNSHLGSALRKTGLILVGWNVRSLDVGAPRDKVVERILRIARDGSIVLLHDGGARPDVLTGIVRDVVAELRARGYSFAGLDEALADEAMPIASGADRLPSA